MVAVDDGSQRFIVRPITRDFIVAQDGSFVGGVAPIGSL
jgi:hypothetical protein